MATVRGSIIRQRSQELAEKITELHYQRQPETWEPYGQAGREKCMRDAVYNLSFLAEAVEADDPRLFSEYLG